MLGVCNGSKHGTCFFTYIIALNPHVSTDKVIRADVGSRAQRTAFSEQAMRRHFITRQDCRNIGRKVKEFSTHRHSDDAISVHRVVRELHEESPSPVLAYKAQGVVSSEIALPDDIFSGAHDRLSIKSVQ